MATNKGNLCKDIFGQSVYIKGREVIDENRNISGRSLKVTDASVRRNLDVCGGIKSGANVEDRCAGDLYSMERPCDLKRIQSRGFVGDFEPTNWTINLNGGSVTFTETTLTLVSSDTEGMGESNTTACVTYEFSDDTFIKFDWDFTTEDDSSFYDPFGYILNGQFCELTKDEDGINQNGRAVVAVCASDEFTFCFNARSTDQCCGPSTTVVTNFCIGNEPKTQKVLHFKPQEPCYSIEYLSSEGEFELDPISLDKTVSVFNTSGGANGDLADGKLGQIKIFVAPSPADYTPTVTVAFTSNAYSDVQFTQPNASVTMLWIGTEWVCIGSCGSGILFTPLSP